MQRGSKGRKGRQTYIRSVAAQMKRAFELNVMNDEFRGAVSRDLNAGLRQFDLDIPEVLAKITVRPRETQREYANLSPMEEEIAREYNKRAADYMSFIYADPDRHGGCAGNYLAWRRHVMAEDVIARGGMARMHLHLPFTVELSHGCSVGCWFCGVSAEEFRGHHPATKENLAEWAAMLRVLKRQFGNFAQRGFLYWGTDPMDNPDYETFCDVFADETGRWPATTTALAGADLERTARLIRRGRERNTSCTRFSILSLRIMDRILQRFTPEDLYDVPLSPANKESIFGMANAGHALERAQRQPDRMEREHRKLQVLKEVPAVWYSGKEQASVDIVHETICCVAGFLINLVKCSVELICPVKATLANTKGYWVMDAGEYRDAVEFDAVIQRMMDKHMVAALNGDERVTLHPAVEYSGRPACLFKSRRGFRKVYASRRSPGVYGDAASMSDAADRKASDLRAGLIDKGHPEDEVDLALNTLWDDGVLVHSEWAALETAR